MDNKNAWISWVIGVLVVIGLGYLVFSQKPAPTATPDAAVKTGETTKLEGEVKIGAIMPLTGDATAYGLPIQKAILLAVEEINNNGGIAGKKLVMISEDGKCDGKEGATAAQKLINVDQVKFIIGGACSGETLGFAPIANQNKVVVLSPSATSPDITTQGGPYVFRFAPSDAMAGLVAASYASDKLGAKTAAVVSENTDYAQGLRRIFTESFKKNGGSIAYDENYNSGVTDFRTQALKIKNANVDVVYVVPQNPASGVAMFKALQDQKVTAKFLTAEILIGGEVAKTNKEVLEGVTGFEPFFDDQSPSAQKFAAAYKAKYNEDLVYPSFQSFGYSEVYLLKELIEKVGYNSEQIKLTLDGLSNWTGGAMTNVSLDANGDIDWKSFNIKQIKDGLVPSVGVHTLK